MARRLFNFCRRLNGSEVEEEGELRLVFVLLCTIIILDIRCIGLQTDSLDIEIHIHNIVLFLLCSQLFYIVVAPILFGMML